MYAVIESGGKQYRVAIGDKLKVESLKLDPGSKLDLGKVLFLSDGKDTKIGNPYLGSKVEATVVGHGRGEKIRVFKLRRRKNSRTQAGHRQNFTELEIISIDGKSAPDAVSQPTDIAEQSAPTEAAPEAAAEPQAADAKIEDAGTAPDADAGDDESTGQKA